MWQVSESGHAGPGAKWRQACQRRRYLLSRSLPCERAIVKRYSLPGADAP